MISLESFLDDGYLLLITSSLSMVTCCIILSIYFLNDQKSLGFGLIVILCSSNLGFNMIVIIDIIRYNITNVNINNL
jgi:hypothetical protein